MSRIVIVQPYLPTYRRPLFERVVHDLSRSGHEVVVSTGFAAGAQRGRGDSASAPWHIARRGLSWTLRGRHFRSYSSWRSWRRSDLVVTELATGLIDTFAALLFRRRRRVIVWGHVGNLTGKANTLFRWLESWQLRHADGVFAYTPAGRQRAVGRGAREETTRSLDNTVDLAALAVAVESRATSSRSKKFGDLEVVPGKTLVYVGALDAPKRIDFLAEAMNSLWVVDPEIRLLVGGIGEQAAMLKDSVDRNQTELLGRVGNEEKAYLAEVGSLMLNPGRVGLVAVESFVMGLPIVTTDWPYHAPEFDYLEPGVDCVIAPGTPKAYALAVADLLADIDAVARLTQNARAKSGWPSMDNMVKNFVEGCREALDSQMTRSRAKLSKKLERD